MSAFSLRSESGAVTAEFMILVPWLLGLVALALGMFRIGLLQLEATSNAHQISRLAARADSLGVPQEFKDLSWQIDITSEAGLVCAKVRDPEFPLVEALACSPSLGR